MFTMCSENDGECIKLITLSDLKINSEFFLGKPDRLLHHSYKEGNI